MKNTSTSSLPSLRSAGLLSHLDDEAYEVRSHVLAARFDAPNDDPFLVMSLLDDEYGFDDIEESVAVGRCATDRVLVFNEFHETAQEPFERRLKAVLDAVGAQRPAGDDDPNNPDLPWETVDCLADALTEAGLQVHVVGVDTYAALLFREAAPTALIELLAEPEPAASERAEVTTRPWWKFWG